MKKAAICANPIKDSDFQLTLTTAALLKKYGADVSVCMPPLHPDMYKLPPSLSVIPMEIALHNADFMVCLGGDGTILHASKDASELNVPIVGINLGQRGFMAEIEPYDLEPLKKVVSGEYEIETRMMLDVSVTRDEHTIYASTALNDAVVSKGAVQRIIDMSVYADGHRILDFSGDGVVVSTPTGSTAYSMSAGGPIIEPEAENIVVTPVCAHSLYVKPYVLTPGRTVSVIVGELIGKSAYLSTDGDEPVELMCGDKVEVSRSNRTVHLIRVTSKSFYENISEKLNRPRGETR